MCLHAITREHKEHNYTHSEARHLLILFVEPFCQNNDIEVMYIGLNGKEDTHILEWMNVSMHEHKPMMEFTCYRDLVLFLESFHYAFEACNNSCMKDAQPFESFSALEERKAA